MDLDLIWACSILIPLPSEEYWSISVWFCKNHRCVPKSRLFGTPARTSSSWPSCSLVFGDAVPNVYSHGGMCGSSLNKLGPTWTVRTQRPDALYFPKSLLAEGRWTKWNGWSEEIMIWENLGQQDHGFGGNSLEKTHLPMRFCSRSVAPNQKTKWSPGRNYLFAAAAVWELQLGQRYLYYILMDADAEAAGVWIGGSIFFPTFFSSAPNIRFGITNKKSQWKWRKETSLPKIPCRKVDDWSVGWRDFQAFLHDWQPAVGLPELFDYHQNLWPIIGSRDFWLANF